MHRIVFFVFLVSVAVLASCTGKSDLSYAYVHPEDEQKEENGQDSISSDTIPIIHEPYSVRYQRTINDKQLRLFQQQLKLAIAQQDTHLLLSILDSNVVTSHGGGEYGLEDFLQNWSRGGLWKKLERLVQLGGEFESDSTYRYPYFTVYKNMRGYENYSRSYPDPYTEYFTVDDTVNLYEDTLRTNILAKLVNCFVYLDYQNSMNYQSDWLELTTYEDSITGFIPKDAVFRTGDYNLIVEKTANGNWHVTSFAPFD